MKTIKLTLAVLVSVLMFGSSSCKKDKAEEIPKSKIIGNWLVTGKYNYDLKLGVKDPTTKKDRLDKFGTDVYTFNEDKSVFLTHTEKYNGEISTQKGTYQISADGKKIVFTSQYKSESPIVETANIDLLTDEILTFSGISDQTKFEPNSTIKWQEIILTKIK